MFNFLKKRAQKVYDSFTLKLSSLFSRHTLNQEFLDELKKVLITSDVGIATTKKIITQLTDDIASKKVSSMEQVQKKLEHLLAQSLVTQQPASESVPRVVMLVGINGSGKTSFAAKYAHLLKQAGKRVLLVAADTFRAAGTSQLDEWAEKINVEIHSGTMGEDPASVIFEACNKFKEGNFDIVIIDTAGRLQTKVNLMKELEKIRKVIGRKLPNEEIQTWLTIDAMIGQNSFSQAEVFHESTSVTGLIVSKLDSSAKGGIVFSIVERFNLPIVFVTHGEKVSDISAFDAKKYAASLFEEA